MTNLWKRFIFVGMDWIMNWNVVSSSFNLTNYKFVKTFAEVIEYWEGV